jgi:hypothetical protein
MRNETNTATTELRLEQAETIFKQLGGKRRLSLMIGAKNFAFGSTPIGETLASFRFAGYRKANHFEVTLNRNDLYDVRLIKIRKFDFDVVETFTDVFAEDLVRLFESETGLYLSL